MRPLLLLAALLLPLAASAQKPVAAPAAQATPGDCATGVAEAELDIAGVRARLYTIGGLFWRGAGAHYEVPQGSGTLAIFAAGLWVSGLVDGELRTASSTYGPWEYWPGPLDENGETTPETCATYDRIWIVAGTDLDAYQVTGIATDDLAEWPVAVGAPYFVDTDGDGAQAVDELTISLDLGDPGYGTKTLDLAAGERPVIFGRQTAWWVMNDAGGDHGWGRTEPLGIEVRVTAWARGGEAEPDLFESTFYRYEIINRSRESIEEGFATFWMDPDLGNFNDDYQGSNAERSLYYVYNGDSDDNGGGGYGVPPPAAGVDLFSGATSSMYFTGAGFGTSDPGNASEVRTFQKALWKDGTPLTVGGSGYNTSGPVTKWMFNGNPPEYWTEYDTDGNGNRNTPADRRGLITSSFPTLAPGERTTVDLGILFATGTDQIDSVYELFEASDQAQALYDAGALTDRVAEPTPPSGTPALLAPADGVTVVDLLATFSWTAVPGATAYRLQISPTTNFDSLIVDWDVDSLSTTVGAGPFPYNDDSPKYWRVRASNLGTLGPASPVRQFRYFRRAFSSFEVVANASGPIAPHPGAAAFQGFPTPANENPASGVQQVNGTRWLFTTGNSGAYTGPYEEFLNRVVRDDNGERAFPHDFEARFTGPSTAYQRFGDGSLVEIPFEIWNVGIGTPDDPSDDVRLIPVIVDIDGDGTYNLSTADSPVSSSDDDPATDWVYWYEPLDTTPGDAGYRAWLATAASNPEAHGPEVLARTVFVGWNLGHQPHYAAEHPEPGTVFRLVSSDLFGVAAGDEAPSPSGLALAVGPNPARGAATVRYTVASGGPVRLRVLDVLGREVAVLASGPRPPGDHTAAFDASRLATGLYLVVLDADGARLARPLTIAR
ncbi:hypothetical protein [Rubrivirga sp. IMCC45206]|uniref:hypothetical protein n=1 Tax=Rubrivirga sp. IMCC45206 TaxID=3391614 RepID=UPI0039900B23